MSGKNLENTKKLQNLYIEFQTAEEQMKQVESQLQRFEEHAAELESIKESLDELKKTQPGTEILVPVSQGIFVRASIRNPDELIVNVGGNSAVEKDVEGTKQLINVQLREIEAAKKDLMSMLLKLSAKLKNLEAEITKIAEAEN
ncbi:prefoldin subunit alpha [Candidatus Woesearchaeota archaeon]|nr:MAG: prefoldin subunit alpha [Candidatus Woesearchaeota archaeon]